LNNCDERQGAQGTNECVLPNLRAPFDDRSEIADMSNVVIFPEPTTKLFKIEPFVRAIFDSSVIKIEAIYVDDRAIRWWPQGKKNGRSFYGTARRTLVGSGEL
jgi:hypothetical protein